MQVTSTMREKQLQVRLNEEEWARAEALATHFGTTPATVVRMLIVEKARDLGLEHPTPNTLTPSEAFEAASFLYRVDCYNKKQEQKWTEPERSGFEDGDVYVLRNGQGKVLARYPRALLLRSKR